VARALSQYAKARVLLERSLALSRKEHCDSIEAITLHNLGTIADFQGDLAGALRYFRRSLRKKRQLHSVSNSIAITHLALAVIARKLGRYASANRSLSTVAALVFPLNDKRLIAFYWQERAKLEYVTTIGTPLKSADAALELFEGLDSPRDIRETQELLAKIRRLDALDN
jgi:tetratricopeptide (TPR) repeat protein